MLDVAFARGIVMGTRPSLRMTFFADVFLLCFDSCVFHSGVPKENYTVCIAYSNGKLQSSSGSSATNKQIALRRLNEAACRVRYRSNPQAQG
jgi:hypothetical protein